MPTKRVVFAHTRYITVCPRYEVLIRSSNGQYCLAFQYRRSARNPLTDTLISKTCFLIKQLSNKISLSFCIRLNCIYAKSE